MPGGRPPKSAALKALAGNPGKRTAPAVEAKPTPKLPTPPRYLSVVAKREWRRQGKELVRLGLITNIDLRAFELFCTTYERWLDAHTAVTELGMVVYTPSGYPMVRPEFTLQMKLQEQMLRLLQQFGLTPSSRAKAATAAAAVEESDPAALWMIRGAKA